jgi:hypothetical protein
MAYTGKELAEQYGSADNIPHDVLYEFLCQQDTRDELRKLLAPYRDKLKEAAETKDKDQKEFFLKSANEKLEEFKKTSFIASVRRRCKSDLEWLNCYFCWETNPEGAGKPISENRVTRASHGPILDFFVKKDDTKRIAEQDSRKLRLLLWPRGGMKSTIDVVDSVQWILNFPGIRILYLTADDDLAVGFVDETKGHFIQKMDELSLMNLFFPEFCVEESKLGNQFEFNCPVWAAKQINRKEPTVQASSLGSSLSGRHYEVIKADDAVANRNSENDIQCKKVARQISLSARPGKMLRPFGYFDAVGTRYHEEDYYGEIIEKNVGDLKTTTGKCWTLTENSTTGQLILIGKAIVIRPEVVEKLEKEARPTTYIEAGRDGCDLLLPDIMPYSFLMGEYSDNEDTFEGQLNQNPRSQGSTTFDRPLLLRSTVPFSALPYAGPVSIVWDFAGPFNNKKGRDYCAGAAAQWNDKGQCFIVDLIRSRYRPADLAKAVVDFAKKWHPFIVGIEEAAGAKFLEPAILAESAKTGDQQVIQILSRIDWISPDNQKDAKNMRVAALHPWLVHDRLKFANFLPFLQVLYDEFERCLHGTGHNDIPDVISYQPRYAPRVMQAMVKQGETNPMWSMSLDQAQHNLLFEEGTDAFGRVGYMPMTPIVTPEPEPEIQATEMYPGVQSVLGAGF